MKIIVLGIWLATLLFFSVVQGTAEQQEVLLGFSTDWEKGEITIEVASSGCTKKEDFRFEYKENTLTVIRKQRDACKAMPEKISLTFKLKEIGIDPNTPFRISNLFMVNGLMAGSIIKN